MNALPYDPTRLRQLAQEIIANVHELAQAGRVEWPILEALEQDLDEAMAAAHSTLTDAATA